VAALDTWAGYHPQLEDEILPQTDDLVVGDELHEAFDLLLVHPRPLYFALTLPRQRFRNELFSLT